MLPAGSLIEYFIAIAEAGSVSAAALRLGVAQPSLTLALQRLEQELGMALFEREPRGMRLTEAGHSALEGARRLRESWQEVRDVVRRHRHQISGRVTLGCHAAVAGYALPNLVAKLQKFAPEIELILRHDLSRHLTQLVVERELDLALVINPLRHPDLVVKHLLHDEVGFWVAPDFEFISLDQHGLIADPDLLQVQALLRKVQRRRKPSLKILATSQLEVVASLTQAGVGVGLLPRRVALSGGRRLKWLSDLPVFHDELCLIYRPERRARAGVKAVIDFIPQAMPR